MRALGQIEDNLCLVLCVLFGWSECEITFLYTIGYLSDVLCEQDRAEYRVFQSVILGKAPLVEFIVHDSQNRVVCLIHSFELWYEAIDLTLQVLVVVFLDQVI